LRRDPRPEWRDDWKRWTSVTAVARDNLFFVPPELIQRHAPRLLLRGLPDRSGDDHRLAAAASSGLAK
jgi:hypothetical protein